MLVQSLPRKEVIHPQCLRRDTLLRLNPNHSSHLRQLPPYGWGLLTSGVTNFRGLTAVCTIPENVFTANISDLRLLAILTS